MYTIFYKIVAGSLNGLRTVGSTEGRVHQTPDGENASEAMRTTAGLGVSAAVALCMAAGEARAQSRALPVDIASADECVTHVVSAEYGIDQIGAGSYVNPYRTLGFAMVQASQTAEKDVIVLLPGEYSPLPGGSGDTWPLNVEPGVSIQGTNALNTVLRSTNSATDMLVFSPNSPTSFDDSVIDGVTIVGGRVLIDIVDNAPNGFAYAANPTIANCFLLDATNCAISMRNPSGLSGARPYQPQDKDSNGFVEHRPKIVNCTFRLNAIAIFNGAAGFIPSGPNTRAESEPGIVNSLMSGNVYDMEGIDDLQILSSAFDTANVMMKSTPKRPTQPVPVFMPGSRDLHIDMSQPTATPVDVRLVPFARSAPFTVNPAIDSGTTALRWRNGTIGKRYFACSIDIRDVDCEGYGNPRTERNRIDIGADESGQLIFAGYIPGTTAYNSNLPTHNIAMIWSNPFPGFGTAPFEDNVFMEIQQFFPPIRPYREWSPAWIPGSRGIVTSAPTSIANLGTQWISSLTGTKLVFQGMLPWVPVSLPIPTGLPELMVGAQDVPNVGQQFGQLGNQQTFIIKP